VVRLGVTFWSGSRDSSEVRIDAFSISYRPFWASD
jgi:hypothetical protein